MDALQSVGQNTPLVFSVRGAPGYVRIATTGVGASPVRRCEGHTSDDDPEVVAWENDPDVVGSLCCLRCRGRWWRRGKVQAWSRRSRARLTRTLAAVDFAAVAERWCLLTLTYQVFDADPRSWKADLSAFRQRWTRKFGAPPRGFVVLEWQRPRLWGPNQGQSAPHFHAVFIAPAGDVREAEFWAKAAWHAVVTGDGHGPECLPLHDDDGNETRAALCAHATYGAKLTDADSWSASGYLTRELKKGRRSRQKELPPEWATLGVGRWWMNWGHVPVTERVVPLTRTEFATLRAWLRRIAHRRGYHAESRYRDQGLLLFDRASVTPARGRRKRDLRAAGQDPVLASDSAYFTGDGGVMFDAVLAFLIRMRGDERWSRYVGYRLAESYCCCPLRESLPSFDLSCAPA